LLCHVEDDPTVAFHLFWVHFWIKFGWCVENAKETNHGPPDLRLLTPGSPMVSPWPYGMPQMSPMTPMVRGSSAANPVGLPQNGHESGEESWFLLVHGEKPWFLGCKS